MSTLTREQLADYKDELFSHMLAGNIYTPLCFFYTLPDKSVKDDIIARLQNGIERLSRTFPWITAQLVESERASMEILPHERTCRFTVKDYSYSASTSSMSSFRRTRFPCDAIDGEALTSLVGIPNTRPGEPKLIFFVQANLIDNGLILSFAGEHSAMDGHGTGQVIRLLSKACSEDPFTEEELREGNRTSKGLIPLFTGDHHEPGVELDYLVERAQHSAVTPINSERPSCTWAYIKFSAGNITKLKEMATVDPATSKLLNVAYITSNDAVSAFIWKYISQVRASRLPADTKSTLGRAVDVRTALGISPCYLGNASNHAYTTLPINSFAALPLNEIAATLRSALQPMDLARGISSLATYFSQATDRSKIHYGSNMNFSHDLFISSWAKLPCYQLDFGLGLGLPEAVRRPGFLEIEGLIYLLPMDNSGGFEAMICLRDEDIEKLKDTPEFGRFSDWIG